ncbi:protein SPIRRIG-like isoform X2 [Nymphaea colorata]|uniref:protein SPIRRIG-like isoform X2 n=1 Tax=Nymphaea colorata TaxID=210225 RepID=UPI00129DD7F9|nr:protein SPIRRIG-like isoform X2 [Nymphaea colorata]
MKWVSLLRDIKEKVGFSQPPASSPTATAAAGEDDASPRDGLSSPIASENREKYELELDFKRNWELFRSSSLEKEKEDALNVAVDIFCRLLKWKTDVSQVINILSEPYIFSFVIARTFVADIEKLKSLSKSKCLHISSILGFFTNSIKESINPGLNLLYAIQALVSGPLDKQPLLDSGILCCLIHILNALLSPDNENNQAQAAVSEASILQEKPQNNSVTEAHQLEVEEIMMHVMKVLANQPSAALSLVEDNSLQLLFQMVANGSLTVFSRFRLGFTSFRSIQLHRHAMQILHLLLANDNGSTANYIRKHHLIKILLMAVKDFNPETGDSTSTMGIIVILLECVELSYRPEAGGIKLREDIHNAHGYQFLVQFALILSSSLKVNLVDSKSASMNSNNSGGSHASGMIEQTFSASPLQSQILPSLSWLLDLMVNLAQTGPVEITSVGDIAPKSSNSKIPGHQRQFSLEKIKDRRERGSNQVKDLEAVQMLQDIFLKAEDVYLQAEVLDRMLKIFSSHVDNYKICQQLRVIPLFVLNMAEFPALLQEKILKILEYAVTVVNYVPEQELLSLCCLLQQPIETELKHSILSFFVKLLSFDQQYKNVLREVGLLELLLDDIKQHKYLCGVEHQNANFSVEQSVPFSRSLTIRKDDSDAILSSPRIGGPASGKFRVFEDEGTITVAWDCLIALLKKSEANQSTFRMSSGVTLILPFLTSDTQRSGVLRLLSCLIMEDVQQAHAEELGSLIEILKSGIVTSISGFQYKLNDDAKCDILAATWRVLGVNQSAQRVFGEATGFSLLLTMFPSLQSGAEDDDGQSPLTIHMKLFCFLLRVITAGVCNNAINRISLHAIISSQTFSDLLNESGLICVDYEREVIQLLLELALEIVLPPSFIVTMQQEESVPIPKIIELGDSGYLISSSSGNDRLDKDRVYNAGAVVVLIRSLLLFTPKLQLELLNFIEKLAHGASFNQENLTFIGCVELLLETIHPFLAGSSPLLLHALRVVQVLGAYRLSSAELQILLRYILQLKLINSGHVLIGVMKKLVNMEEVTSENVSLSPFLEMDMSKMGHASIQVSLGERTWPPALGYSFICWFWFSKFMNNTEKQGWQSNISTKMATSGGKNIGKQAFRIFSVGNVEDANTFYTQLYLQDDGVFILSMGNSSSVLFPSVELQENRWHHLAVVYSKPNALAGLFQAGVAYLYLNGKLRQAKKLGYSPSPVGKPLQVTIGTPISHAKVTELCWRMRSCYFYEEVITPGAVFFMYLLGRKYQGLFQDTNLLQFVPNEACGGDNMAILDSLDSELSVTSNIQRPDGDSKQERLGQQERLGAHGSRMVWDLESLRNLSLELSGKKLIFAFDGTSGSFRTSGMLATLNLVDPTSAAASSIGGIPRFGRLHGDIFIGSPCVIGDSIRAVGGMTIILAVVEAAETRDMLHMALSLLASALHKNPKNVHDMRACRGYHLLALFLYRRMALLDLQLLNILFQIAACEASFCGTWKLQQNEGMSNISQASMVTYDHGTMARSPDEFLAFGFLGDLEGFMEEKDLVNCISEVESAGLKQQNLNCMVLSNVDMVEHVLLDWTLWATATIPIQIALLRFLEHLVLMNWYRIHNLAILRQINLVKYLLITMQRDDIEVTVLEKLVVLLRSILGDGFIGSELELVVRFVIMSFGPPELAEDHQVRREPMGNHIIVRNMLLEMLIDLQVAIKSEEVLEQWHRIVSSKLITFFLDEAIHPTSMRWVMILLGVCLTSSSFSLKFHISGGFQGLTGILPSFYDSPEVYYILFCLVFGKDVYPRLPEVRMLDFHALIPRCLSQNELKFVDLLESVVAMAKTTFDKLSLEATVACEAGVHSPVSASLTAELAEETKHIGVELQGEALMHKTYAARLMGGTAEAPAAAASILRFMVDLAKMCHQFSAICQRADFLKCCVDLYFSCVRAACAVKAAKKMNQQTPGDRNLNDADDTHSLQPASCCLSNQQELPSRTTTSTGSFPQVQISSISEDLSGIQNIISEDCRNQRGTFDLISGQAYLAHAVGSQELGIQQNEEMHSSLQQTDSSSFASSLVLDAPALSRKSNWKVGRAKLAPSTIVALTSWLGSGHSSSKAQGSLVTNMPFTINSQLLLEMDDAGSEGGPCVASASAVLDFIAEVFADMVTGQSKAAQVIEGVLETIPLYIDMESAIVFQGLCLSRLMNFMERRLLCDDAGTEKGLDKNCWSINLDTISGMIVDRVYMGAFPRPSGVLKTLEFLLSMLQFSNKNRCIQEAIYTGKGQLPLTRGSEQLELYIYSLLKNTNRMIMYCFLPSFLSTIGENDLLSRIGFQVEQRKSVLTNMTEKNTSEIDICTILQLLIAHQRLVICPANLDTDVTSCLTINLICLLRDQRQNVQKMAEDLLKYLLVHRRAALEELLVSKATHGQYLDVLHGGLDRLLTGSSLAFYDWLQASEQIVNKVLKQCAAIMWAQFVAGSAKFPGVRIKGIEMRRKREMVRRLQEVSKCELKHFEQLNERRNELGLVREGMSTELRVLQLDKYGSILHAESEWQGQLEQLVHERGICPIERFINEPQWQLCPIEGPYRMRKKLERCKLRIGSIESILNRLRDLEGDEKDVDHPLDTGTDLGSNFPLLSGSSKKKYFDGIEYHDSFFEETEESNEDPFSAHIGSDDDNPSSKTEPSVSSALEVEVKSSSFSTQSGENPKVRSDLSSLEQSTSISVDKSKDVANKLEKKIYDNGEHLVRPFLEPFENVRFCYNCERVIGLDKHDGIFLVGDLCLYVIENFYIDDAGRICEKESEDKLSVIDQALGVTRDTTGSLDLETSFSVSWDMRVKTLVGGRAWAYAGGAWGKEKIYNSGDLSHPRRMWKLDDVHDILKRDYQLRPVAVEIFSMDGCNDLLVFHKKEREEVFKNLMAMDLLKNSIASYNRLSTTIISGSLKQDNIEQSRLFRIMAQSFSKRWQNGEISNFQYLMHLNTLAGRGYNDLTQYPVFPWVLADYESDTLDLSDPKIYRKLDKPMGCQTAEGEEEFRKRYENWDDPDVPKFHYGSHYSTAAIVLFYLLRLPPFSIENQKLQGGQFDRADRLFSSIKDTWLSASTKGNTSDVKELIPEFFYMPEFLENRFNLKLGEKQSGEKVGDVLLPPWAKGSAREFVRKHREALESDYVSENLHHWIDLIFGHKQRGEAAEESVNVFYHYTYEGSVDIDAVSDPAIKSSILAQINHFGQTPRQLFLKPHGKRRCKWKLPVRMLQHCNHLIPHEVHKAAFPITQIVTFYEKILVVGINNLLEPLSYSTYIAWGYPDRSLRFISYDQGRLLSTHENLHGGNQLWCAGVSHDGQVLVTGGDDGIVSVWQIVRDGNHGQRQLQLKKTLCAHTAKITCLFVSQPYTLIVSGSEDCTVLLWDLNGLLFVKQLPEFPAPVSAVYVNDLTGEIVTAAGILLAVWSINGDCLAVVNTSQLPSDLIMSLTGSVFSDWLEANWFISGHQSGAIKVWRMVYFSDEMKASSEASGKSVSSNRIMEGNLELGVKSAEYRLMLYKVLKAHKDPVLALHLTSDLKQLLSGDSGGNLLSWTLPDESVRSSSNQHREG